MLKAFEKSWEISLKFHSFYKTVIFFIQSKSFLEQWSSYLQFFQFVFWFNSLHQWEDLSRIFQLLKNLRWRIQQNLLWFKNEKFQKKYFTIILQEKYNKDYRIQMAENRAFLNFVRNKKFMDDFNEKKAEDAGFNMTINRWTKQN